MTAVMLAIVPAAVTEAQTPGAADAGIAPFFGALPGGLESISVGTSDLELKNDTQPGHYLYTWTITARGIFRVVYHDDLIQKSWFGVDGDHVRPERYPRRRRLIQRRPDFRWTGGTHSRRTSETKPVDLETQGGDAGRDVHPGRSDARPQERSPTEYLPDHRQG